MSDLPQTVHVHDPYDLYIGRRNNRAGLVQSDWANPYPTTIYMLDESLALYETYIRESPTLWPRLPELRGLRLGCWCAKPGQVLTADDPLVCHGQTLARLFREVCGG